MSYEYKNEIIMNIKDYNAGRKVTGGTHAFESKLEELDRVYARAAKADEYEAKAKVLDRVKEFAEEPPFLLANNENEDYERYAYDQILKLINKYESGESE